MLTIAPGDLFARDYQVERALAAGGMGAVYVVRQLSTGRRRALKLMQPELVAHDDLRRRFLLEAKVGASIASEHVVEVQVAGIDDATGAPYLVMELLDGVDLATQLERHGPLSLAETSELFRQMCHALGLAHKAGIVHRDLKPPNVFLATPKRADDGSAFHVKVLDFGIAKMTTDATLGDAKTGMIGTPLWMAPEQADYVGVTPAADVWALGLMLYTCITGRSFWRTGETGGSLQQIMREMLFDPIPRAGARAAEQGIAFPPALEGLIERSIVRKPEQRMRDANAFYAALEDALAGKAIPLMTRGELELDLGGGTGIELERAPRSAPAIAALPPTRPMITTPAPSPIAATQPRPPAALADGWRAPWWLVYSVPLVIVAALVAAGYSMSHPKEPDVSCRLCTVEDRTVANGQLPLRDLRHGIEERFPALDKRCLKDAKRSGRATFKWTIVGGDVVTRDPQRRPSVTPYGNTEGCILSALTGGVGGQYPLGTTSPLGEATPALGETDVTYTLEWNPTFDAPWLHDPP